MVTYCAGGFLIWLAIEKQSEPSLLLPMGFGAILVNPPLSGVIDQMTSWARNGIIQWLFEAGIEASEAFLLLLFIGIGAMIDFGPLLANPAVPCSARRRVGRHFSLTIIAPRCWASTSSTRLHWCIIGRRTGRPRSRCVAGARLALCRRGIAVAYSESGAGADHPAVCDRFGDDKEGNAAR